jgi:SAM-dependent methyltransferase
VFWGYEHPRVGETSILVVHLGAGVKLRKYLLIPRILLDAARAPKDQHLAWDLYWSRVTRTGVDGDVLWDAGVQAELDAAVKHLYAHADSGLPLVDLGCGNGRQARAFTQYAPRVVGVDGSAVAISRAQAEAAESPPPGPGSLEFRVADAADPGLGELLHAELGEVNVHIRGLLHIVDPPDRLTVVANVREMLGNRGTAYVCETNLPGDPLDYLVFQGATPTSMPTALRRLVASGLRPPSHFGPTELAQYFPAAHGWHILAHGPTRIYGVPRQPGDSLQHIPGYFGVLRRRTER